MINSINNNKPMFFTGATVKPKMETKEELSDLFVKSDCNLNQKINELENIFSQNS